MSKATEIIRGIRSSLLAEGADGYKIRTYGKDDPEIVAWVRDSGNETFIRFEIDGEKQKAAIKIDKKKKKATGTSA